MLGRPLRRPAHGRASSYGRTSRVAPPARLGDDVALHIALLPPPIAPQVGPKDRSRARFREIEKLKRLSRRRDPHADRAVGQHPREGKERHLRAAQRLRTLRNGSKAPVAAAPRLSTRIDRVPALARGLAKTVDGLRTATRRSGPAPLRPRCRLRRLGPTAHLFE